MPLYKKPHMAAFSLCSLVRSQYVGVGWKKKQRMICMRFDVPERPYSERYQQRRERLVFILILVFCAVLLSAGVVTLFSGVLEKLFLLVAAYFSWWVASKNYDSMRSEYDKKANAWDSYWADYWEEERQLRIQIDRLWRDENSDERNQLQKKLDTLHRHYEKHYPC